MPEQTLILSPVSLSLPPPRTQPLVFLIILAILSYSLLPFCKPTATSLVLPGAGDLMSVGYNLVHVAKEALNLLT